MKSVSWVKDKIEYIKNNINFSLDNWKDNRKYFSIAKTFVGLTTISDSDKAILNELKLPKISCNVTEKHVLRLLGEFNNQCPTIDVYYDPCAKNPDQNLLEFIKCHFKVILNNVNLSDVFRDCLLGGFSAMKITNEYENYKTMRQKIELKKVNNPLMVGFDPDAKERHKGDGTFAFEIIPIKQSTLKMMYEKDILGDILTDKDYSACFANDISVDNVRTANSNNKGDEISFICDFFCKESKPIKIFKLADGSEMSGDEYNEYLKKCDYFKEVALKVASIRKSFITKIRHFRILGDKILSTSILPFKKLPIIFFDGNSDFYTKNPNDIYATKQHVKSYLHNTFSLQKAKDQVFRTIVKQIENRPVGHWVIPIEGIGSDEQMKQYNNVQAPINILYKQFSDDAGDGVVRELRPPAFVESPPIDQSAVAVFNSFDRSIDEVLGVYNQESSVNNGVVSGKAIIQGSLNSNSASKPFYTNFLVSFQRVAEVVLSGMNDIYIEQNRPINVIDQDNKSINVITNPSSGVDGVHINFDDEDIKISIKAGFNFEIQKNRDIETILHAAGTVPGIASIVNQPTVSGKILENLAIGEISAPIKETVDKLILEQKQKENTPPPPDLMQIKIQIEQQKLAIEQQKNEIAKMKVLLDHKATMSKVSNEKDKNNTDKIVALSDVTNEKNYMDLQAKKMQTEREVHHLKHINETRKINHDILKTALNRHSGNDTINDVKNETDKTESENINDIQNPED